MSQKKISKVLKGNPGYKVGYGKPPEHTRFKPGQSGNPRGRPKGSKNKRPDMHHERMTDIILEEAYRSMTVREGNRNLKVPVVRAVMRSLGVNAVRGRPWAQRLFTELVGTAESSRKMLRDEWLKTAIEYKVGWEEELWRREQLGITGLPEPLPHPDHVIIDFAEGTAKIVGPKTKEEKVAYDWVIERREYFARVLERLLDEREKSSNADENALLDKDIEHARRVLNIIESGLS